MSKYYHWLGADAENVEGHSDDCPARLPDASIKYIEEMVALGLVRLVDEIPGDGR